MPTDFLDLPLELRNEVYHILWEHTPVFEQWYGIDNNVTIWPIMDNCIGNITCKNTTMPAWLLACKQILQEGIAEFNFGGHWEVWSDGLVDLAHKPGLFRPSEARHIYFCFFHGLSAEHRRLELVTASMVYAPIPESIDTLLQWASKTGKAKSICICFSVSDDEMFDKEVDLSKIVDIVFSNSSLTKLTVGISHEHPKRLGNAFERSFVGETKRLGISMMGAITEPTMEVYTNEDKGEKTYTVAFHRLPSPIRSSSVIN